MSIKDLIVFDMDGVLVDVSETYRVAIQATVGHFTGTEPSGDEVQSWKNRGGYNDDWKLSHAMIRDKGHSVPYDDVVKRFQTLFLGTNNDGLIMRERWIAAPGLLDRLAVNHTLAIFTGRLRAEADLTLNRFAKNVFAPIVGVGDVTNPKPAPEGLEKIRAAVPHRKMWYLGDTVDDARSARAAGVSFIGISAPTAPQSSELTRLLRSEGAIAVFDDINSLEAFLAQNR